MIVKNASNCNMLETLERINKKYEGNVIWNRYEVKGSQIHFTLRVKDSKRPGHRLGYSRTSKGNRRRLTSACWHVHGDFFDALIEVNPEVVIRTMHGTIDKDGGNWQDKQVGSMMDPVMYSQLCDCNGIEFKHVKQGLDWKIAKVTQVQQSSLTAECWLVQAWGLDQCKTCEALDTKECGGRKIRLTGINEKGLQVPL